MLQDDIWTYTILKMAAALPDTKTAIDESPQRAGARQLLKSRLECAALHAMLADDSLASVMTSADQCGALRLGYMLLLLLLFLLLPVSKSNYTFPVRGLGVCRDCLANLFCPIIPISAKTPLHNICSHYPMQF
jgi:hypothetical protein